MVLGYRNALVLESWIHRLQQSLNSLKVDWEIILVTNAYPGEKDEAQTIAKNLEKNLPHVTNVALTKAGGYGWDVQSGLAAARGDILAYVDGDGQIAPEAVAAGFREMLAGEWDLVKARRIDRQDGPYRRLLSLFFNLFLRVLFPTHHSDINAKPKLFSRKVWEALKLRSDDWFIDAELMIKAEKLHLKIGEFPICFYTLSGRPSLVGLKTIGEFLKNFWKYRFGEKNGVSSCKPQSL